MKARSRHAWASIALVLALACLPLLMLTRHMLDHGRETERALSDTAARHARLQGLLAAAPDIAIVLERAHDMLERYAYPADFGTERIGTDVQQRIRRIASDSAINLVGSQTLPPAEIEGTRIIAVSATLDGDIAGLRDFLQALERERPLIAVARLGVSSVNLPGNAQGHALRAQIGLEVVELMP